MEVSDMRTWLLGDRIVFMDMIYGTEEDIFLHQSTSQQQVQFIPVI